jgi:hypothetical protein
MKVLSIVISLSRFPTPTNFITRSACSSQYDRQLSLSFNVNVKGMRKLYPSMASFSTILKGTSREKGSIRQTTATLWPAFEAWIAETSV